jgi:hypothetical protein
VHIGGPRAAEMIAEALLGHLPFAETLMEAAMAVRQCRNRFNTPPTQKRPVITRNAQEKGL